MTVRKTTISAVAQLRDEVHGYHIEVTEALATMQANCQHCHKIVSDLDLQINGEKPERSDAPGLKHDVDNLKIARDNLVSSHRRVIQYAWAVFTVVGGFVVTLFSYKSWK